MTLTNDPARFQPNAGIGGIEIADDHRGVGQRGSHGERGGDKDTKKCFFIAAK